MAESKFTFFFDFMSPYSYVAFTMLQRLKRLWNVSIQLRPVRLPTIIRETQNRPPASVPARAVFLAKDLHRTARLHSIPFAPPANFLSAPMKAAGCLVIAAQDLGWEEAVVCKLAAGIWEEFFAKGRMEHFTDRPDDLRTVLETMVSVEEAHRLVEAAKAPASVGRLHENTENAIKAGAFGVPTMLVTRGSDGTTELFFGSDRFHHIAAFIGVDPRSIYESPNIPSPTSKL